MSDKKESQLATVTSVSGSDLMTGIQGGINKNYSATLIGDYIGSTKTYASLNTTSKILTGAVNEAYQWVRTSTVLSPYNSGDAISIPGSGNLLTIGTTTNLATPAVTLVSNNSGYAAPSNVGATSLGDKWVFWNGTGAYKGAIGFNAREMWFQSTDVGVTDSRFRWFGGSAGIPVEVINIGDIGGFVWNDTGIAIDFRCEGDADPNLWYLKASTDQACVGTNTPIVGAKFTVLGTLGASTLNTANGIVQTSSTGLFSTSTLLPDGTTATTQTAGDNSTKVATTAYVDSKAGTKTPITEELVIGSDGITALTLAHTPYNVAYVNTFLNGQRRRYLIDFTVSGTSFTWNNPGGLTLKTTDSPLIVTYEY